MPSARRPGRARRRTSPRRTPPPRRPRRAARSPARTAGRRAAAPRAPARAGRLAGTTQPGAVDAEQADGADAEIATWCSLARSPSRSESPSSAMLTSARSSSVGCRSAAAGEAHHLDVGRARAGHDRQAEDEQRVREQRAEDRRLRDHDSPAASAKSTMKSSGRLPSVDWSTPVTAGPNSSADSRESPTSQARPPARLRLDEGRGRRRVREVEHAGDRGQDRDRAGDESAASAQPGEAHPLVHRRECRRRRRARLLGADREQPPQLALVRAQLAVALLDRRRPARRPPRRPPP